jgi:hypothetical protein
MDDGSHAEFGPGEVSLIPPGHDVWVAGNEPVVVVDIPAWSNTPGRTRIKFPPRETVRGFAGEDAPRRRVDNAGG